MTEHFDKTLHLAVNNRLAQYLKARLVENVLQGAKVARTPKVMTWSNWWQQWQQAMLLKGVLPASELPRKVLSDFEATLMWESLLAESDDFVLMNLTQTAKQIHQAWLFFNEYVSDEQLSNAYQTEEVRLFLNLKKKYLKKLMQTNCWDSALQMHFRLDFLKKVPDSLPDKVVLYGFDELTPYLQRWCDQLQQLGIKVEAESLGLRETHKQLYYLAENPQSEVQQAACWAVQQLNVTDSEQPRIAIVAPDISEVSSGLIRALDEELFKAKNQRLKSHQQNWQPSMFYNLSLGQSLGECPLAQNALLSLRIFSSEQPVQFNDFSIWLNSPYTGGRLLDRQKLDARLRQWQWPKFTLKALLEKFDTSPGLEVPNQVYEILKSANSTQLSSETISVEHFYKQAVELLDKLNWAKSGANGSLSSQSFQKKQAFEQALLQFSLMEFVLEKHTFKNWLKLLARFVSEQVHQPQSNSQAPIQIMGMLEAGGQSFDGLWIMGLTAKAWPREAKPNPFLPMQLQRDLGVPRSNAKRELQYAEALTKRLACSSQLVVWSSYHMDAGRSMLVSPIIEKRKHYLQDYILQPYQTLAKQQFMQKVPVIWVEDTQAPEVPLGEKVPGGSGILDAQRKCPLMAFFDYRLGARNQLEEVEEGMPKNLLGTLIHEVLEKFWKEVETASKLLAMTEESLRDTLLDLIDDAMIGWRHHFNEHYLQLERQRILVLLVEWLTLEKQRPPFKVIGFEESFLLEIAGILFQLKLDRIDEVEGAAFILDYKTGKASVKDLLKHPLEAPQLAVYLYAIEQQIAGLGYALLHSDDGVKFNTVVADEGLMLKDRSQTVFTKLSDKTDGEFEGMSWAQFLEGLKTEILNLAEAIQKGQASVAFEKEEDLRFAASQLAMRLPEVKQQISL